MYVIDAEIELYTTVLSVLNPIAMLRTKRRCHYCQGLVMVMVIERGEPQKLKPLFDDQTSR